MLKKSKYVTRLRREKDFNSCANKPGRKGCSCGSRANVMLLSVDKRGTFLGTLEKFEVGCVKVKRSESESEKRLTGMQP
jgi:hypothetical protein